MDDLNASLINQALVLLGEELEAAEAPHVHLVVCGGAGLIACGMVARTTHDVDIVAMLDSSGRLSSPDPLPTAVLDAAHKVAAVLDLSENWLNNGPSRGEFGLFQSGLPDGLDKRLASRTFGSNLTVHFVGRFDQICFKVYAATDQGPGRYFGDLRNLAPSEDELVRAVAWAAMQDASPRFRELLHGMVEAMGHHELAARIR